MKEKKIMITAENSNKYEFENVISFGYNNRRRQEKIEIKEGTAKRMRCMAAVRRKCD